MKRTIVTLPRTTNEWNVRTAQKFSPSPSLWGERIGVRGRMRSDSHTAPSPWPSPPMRGRGNCFGRAGITLTQMLVVIALTSVITMAAITTIVTMLRLEGRTTQVWMSQQTLLRLSDDFRSDAHAAKVAEITTQNDAPAVIFQSSAESTKSVTYLVAKHQVTRRETDGDKLLRTEVYRLPDNEVTFGSTTSKNDPPRIQAGETVQLICRRPNTPQINQRTPPPLHDEHVVAVIGRDHRFEKP